MKVLKMLRSPLLDKGWVIVSLSSHTSHEDSVKLQNSHFIMPLHEDITMTDYWWCWYGWSCCQGCHTVKLSLPLFPINVSVNSDFCVFSPRELQSHRLAGLFLTPEICVSIIINNILFRNIIVNLWTISF